RRRVLRSKFLVRQASLSLVAAVSQRSQCIGIRRADNRIASFVSPARRRFAEGAALKILLNRTQVAEGVARMADEINAFYGNKPLTIIGVLTGSIVVMADLIRLLNMPLRVGV